MWRVRRLVLCTLLLGTLSCGDSPTGPPGVASIRIQVAGDTLLLPTQQTLLVASPLDAQGRPLTGRTFEWTSSDTSVSTVSFGIVRAICTGTARISASTEGKSDTIPLRVIPRPVASITVNTSGFDALYAPNDSLSLSVTLRAANGDTLDRGHRPVTWSSSNDGVARVTTSGIVVGQTAGPVTITASRESQSGFVNLTVLPAPASSWSTAADWVTFQADPQRTDRKSTRLNSSHGYISYAVFCLKKKKKPTSTS